MWNDVSVDDSLHDWTHLRKSIQRYGIRNSLLCAPMPTASTSQILNNYECFEPVMTNLYSRRVLAGDYVVINRYMVDDLKLMNLWTTELKDSIIANNGSVSHLDIPQFMKERYKNSLGNQTKRFDRYVKRQRGIYLSIAKLEFVSRKSNLSKTIVDAYIHMETRIENGYLLFENTSFL